MSSFLVFGALAWDRYVRLQGDIKSGARLSGVIKSEAEGRSIGGVLGGGGANAAAALINAGHKTLVYAPVAIGAEGDQVVQSAIQLGIDLRLVSRVDGLKGLTLILVEPCGERIVLGLQDEQVSREDWKRAIAELDPPSLEKIQACNPQGVYLRAAYPGHEHLAQLKAPIIVSHWPLRGLKMKGFCDALITSLDDLDDEFEPGTALQQARDWVGTRLKWLIVTNGSKGGWLCDDEGVRFFTVQPVEQVDATGAGDTFAAGVLEALCGGASITKAIEHGSKWGATTVGLLGGAQQRPAGTYAPWR